MVKVAFAGPGQLAREIIDALVATGKHEIVLLSRRDIIPEQAIDGTTFVKVDYSDKSSVVQALQGVHTVLSFVTTHQDENGLTQKTLIDAAIEAGVKRIAPSEWILADTSYLGWYDGKLEIRKYLEEKNKDKKVIEYSLFQPGWYLNQLASTQRTAKHVGPVTGLIDYEKGVALVAGDLDQLTTYTAVQDIVNIVVKAIGYEGEWPTIGGISGHNLSLRDLLALGEKVRGKPLNVQTLDIEDLQAGVLKGEIPPIDHPSVAHLDEATKLAFAQQVYRGILLNTALTGVNSDEWNQIFPDYKFVKAEEFVASVFPAKA